MTQKVGVLTFHRCINYGSYWQARCLVEGVRARGHDAELLDHHDDSVLSRELRCAFQPALPTRTPRADLPAYGAKTRAFLTAFEALSQSTRFELTAPDAMPDYDVVLVGSDEVWNFRHPWYGGCDLFFGAGLRTRKLAAYAASFGNHDAADGVDARRADLLRRFDAIAVRDANSHALVQDALGIDAPLVLDPVLQFPPQVAPEAAERPYLALYGHGFPDWFARAVRAAADAQGLRVVSIGYGNGWADEQRIAAGPIEFAAFMAGAAAVATNFFHGAVFALANAKPFVAAPTAYRFNKLRDLTAKVGAQRHFVTDATDAAHYAALLAEPLAPAIGETIAGLRARSAAYLDGVLA